MSKSPYSSGSDKALLQKNFKSDFDFRNQFSVSAVKF